jgi:hypothetical protein
MSVQLCSGIRPQLDKICARLDNDWNACRASDGEPKTAFERFRHAVVLTHVPAEESRRSTMWSGDVADKPGYTRERSMQRCLVLE